MHAGTIHYFSDGLETLRYHVREIFAILVTPGSSLGNIWLQVTCVVEHMELPDLLKTAISSACSSGRKLFWKIQECEKKRGNSDTNFDLLILLPPTDGQHPRWLCYRIQQPLSVQHGLTIVTKRSAPCYREMEMVAPSKIC